MSCDGVITAGTIGHEFLYAISGRDARRRACASDVPRFCDRCRELRQPPSVSPCRRTTTTGREFSRRRPSRRPPCSTRSSPLAPLAPRTSRKRPKLRVSRARPSRSTRAIARAARICSSRTRVRATSPHPRFAATRHHRAPTLTPRNLSFFRCRHVCSAPQGGGGQGGEARRHHRQHVRSRAVSRRERAFMSMRTGGEAGRLAPAAARAEYCGQPRRAHQQHRPRQWRTRGA